MNQPGLDSCSQQQEHDRESVIDVWLGADPVLRQALAARLLQQGQHEAEYLLAQRHYRKAIEVYARILVVNPEDAQAFTGVPRPICNGYLVEFTRFYGDSKYEGEPINYAAATGLRSPAQRETETEGGSVRHQYGAYVEK